MQARGLLDIFTEVTDAGVEELTAFYMGFLAAVVALSPELEMDPGVCCLLLELTNAYRDIIRRDL